MSILMGEAQFFNYRNIGCNIKKMPVIKLAMFAVREILPFLLTTGFLKLYLQYGNNENDYLHGINNPTVLTTLNPLLTT
ncbi:MAG: hypothetical protein BWY65_01078 [Firmicutes bacterium ADurb.Bin373]|nr:MAG: hypothetical protein BWY65_01078 [Firmicutes bacterium ADurb.Bin373]